MVGGGIALIAGNIFANESVALVVKVVMPFIGAAAALLTLIVDMRVESTVKEQLGESRDELLSEVGSALRRQLEVVNSNFDSKILALEGLLPVFNFYLDSSVADPLAFRARILDDAVGRLRRLAGGEIELEDSLYYEWLIARLRSGVRTVRAVNVRPLRVFESDPREEAFLLENHSAIVRGAQVTRVYIIQRSELENEDARRILREGYMSNVMCYVAWQEDLAPSLLAEFRGGGLSIYDDEDIFWDRSFLRYSYVTSEVGVNMELYAKLEASVFRAPHPKFASLRSAYSTLFDQYVPTALKVQRQSPETAFCDVLQDLLKRSPNLNGDVRMTIEAEITLLKEACASE